MSEETRDFFKTYTDFVTKVTSDPSLDLDALKERLDEIEADAPPKGAYNVLAAIEDANEMKESEGTRSKDQQFYSKVRGQTLEKGFLGKKGGFDPDII